MEKIRLGISSCLLGEPVRYDGGHRLDRYLRDVLGLHVEYVPVCPEVECGLPVPREPMRLEGHPRAPRLVTIRTRIDHTERMIAWANRRVRELETEGLCGFIFKANSPSSGMARVRVYDGNGVPRKVGAGLFARTLMARFPVLPVEDDGRLNDLSIRENFIERIFVHKRWREEVEKGETPANLVDFHTRHKLLVMAHSPKHYSLMGKLVASGKSLPKQELFLQYRTLLMEALKLKATARKNTNVLQHLAGHFKRQLCADEKRELAELIEGYHAGHLPLIVPVTLIGHYVRKYDQPYLKRQHYLAPHPIELQLRNHV
ncbi:MAG: DUF523 and DUF1722 domain-containing protein [Syntrophobacteraceae bacterium]